MWSGFGTHLLALCNSRNSKHSSQRLHLHKQTKWGQAGTERYPWLLQSQAVKVLAQLWFKWKSSPLDSAGPQWGRLNRPGTVHRELLEYSSSVCWGEEGVAIQIWPPPHCLTSGSEKEPDCTSFVGGHWCKCNQNVFLHSSWILFELPESASTHHWEKTLLITTLI